MQLAEKIDTAIEYGKSLVGAPYRWWKPNLKVISIDYKGSPFYSDADKTEYSKDYIMENGVNCAGLINLLARKIGVVPRNGTLMWIAHHIKVAKNFESEKFDSYPKGTLLIRSFRNAEDQGHMAIVIGDGEILHSYPDFPEAVDGLVNPGVVVEPVTISLGWLNDSKEFYDHVILPEDWIA